MYTINECPYGSRLVGTLYRNDKEYKIYLVDAKNPVRLPFFNVNAVIKYLERMTMDKIYLGDCMEVMERLEDHTIDLVLTDVPYIQEFHDRGFSGKRPNYKKIAEYGSNKELDYTEFFELCLRKMKKVNFFTFCDKETKFEFIRMAKEKGFGYREIPFCKTSPTPFVNSQWLPDVEWGLHIFKDIEVMGDYRTKRGWSTVNNLKEEGINHPTPKKVSEVERILLNISKEGDLVLDPFSGSGTTLIACYNQKRHYIGIEKDETYYNDSWIRLEQHRQQLSLF